MLVFTSIFFDSNSIEEFTTIHNNAGSLFLLFAGKEFLLNFEKNFKIF